jgi:hypothetical protein
VKDGRLTTPSGMSYRVLFVPPHVTRWTLPALRKVRDLVSEGAVLAGPKPVAGLGMASPDSQVRRLADEIWGARPIAEGGRSFGRGRIYGTLSHALSAEGVAPDVRISGPSGSSDILTLHRRTDEADIYYVTNQSNRARSVEALFRVTGKAPELWRAETGASERVSFRQANGATAVPLNLSAHEAVFVVFRRPANAPAWDAPSKQTTTLAEVQGPWSVRFGPKHTAVFERLASWAESRDTKIKYHSGSATYRKDVALTADHLSGGQVLLDLGEVRELAIVTVNGRTMGTSWHAPFRIDVTGALKPGLNQLEIRVVNLWPNRLIGDKRPGVKPIAFAPQSPYRADSPLLRSG